MPRPAPQFTRVDDYWIWIPVKKPHSSSFDGQTHNYLPQEEGSPMFVEELSAERSGKRYKPSIDCLHCGRQHIAAEAKIALCTPACKCSYYST
jgi:hypothetical protein